MLKSKTIDILHFTEKTNYLDSKRLNENNLYSKSNSLSHSQVTATVDNI